MKKNKVKRILSICFTVCGLIMTVLFSVLSNGYPRPDETYYHYSEGSFGYGYIEIKTNKNIDVDNCFVYLESTYSTNKEQLDYQGYDGYYNFKYYKHDYVFKYIEIRDESGLLIELTKYTEIEEIERQKPISIMITFAVLGVALTIIGVLLLLNSFGKFHFKKQLNELKDDNQSVEITNNKDTSSLTVIINKNSNTKSITCKYCGSENREDSLNCSNCGAVINSKKSH